MPAGDGGACGAWATVVTARIAAVNKATAAAARDREDDFKRRVSSRVEMVSLMDGILPKKDAFAD